MKVPVHSDYANWIQRIWQKQVEFPDLVTYASQPDFSPSLAAVLYQTWLKRNLSPFNAFAWFNLGVLLFSEKDFAGAQAAYESALAIKPDLVSARFNLGLVFERLGKTEEAIEQWKTVEETAKPEISDEFAVLISALNSTGRLQETLKQYQPACAALEKSLLLKPAQKDVIHHLIFMRQKQCQWPIYAPVGDTNEDTLRNGTSALAMLNVSDDPATQLEAALSYSRAKILANLPSLAPIHGYRHDKIRIAYCSGDFCTHPVAMLMVELLEEHDREKFEIYAFCWSPNDGSGLRQRVIQGVDHYIPIHELSEADSARLIREHEIDILVDLHGQTNNARIQMLAHRPAPIQITYLGLPATTGLPCIDYVIADRFLIPEEHAGCYSEKPLYMPDVYQVSDRKRAIGKTPTRTDCGLPDDKFVFCSFNNNHKYTLEVFTTWMNILRQVPDSVLWLLADNPWSRANLLKQAEAQGIDPNRLFFAERALPADYLARYHVADLFLDTFPFNAGTTANDALWMELPVLTMSGRSFAARMAGALLTAAGLPELITYDLKTYESKAIKLAKDVRALKRLRKKLADAKTKSPLFNTTQFARNLETHYIELVTAFDQQTATARPARQVAPASKPLQKTKQLIEIATEAEQFQAQGDIASAIQIYRQWIKQSQSQDKWVAWFNLGALLNNNGDLTGAEQAFQAVLELQPNFAPAKAALGKIDNESTPQKNSTKQKLCNYCQNEVAEFLPYRSNQQSQVMQSLNMIGSDIKNFGCPHCGSTDRERHLKLYCSALKILKKNARILHFAPEWNFASYIAQFDPEIHIFADLHSKDLRFENINIEKIPYSDSSFDFVIANHVMEHVANPDSALAEINRVLKADGVAILQTPYSGRLQKTLNDPGINTDELRLEFYGQEDHVRLFGQDIFDKYSAYLTPEVVSHQSLFGPGVAEAFGTNAQEPFFLFRKKINDFNLTPIIQESISRQKKSKKPLVSIICVTYNHEHLVQKTLESFATQETDFHYEILIGEDCSTDGTKKIIENFHHENHKCTLRPFFNIVNQGANANLAKLLTEASGKYIAICDGDDYWADRRKLQKQTDFLESNPDISIAYSTVNSHRHGVEPRLDYTYVGGNRRDLTAEELKHAPPINTLTAIFRNVIQPLPGELYTAGAADMFLWSLLGWHGRGHYLTSVLPSIYQQHSGGIFSGTNREGRWMLDLMTSYSLLLYYKRHKESMLTDYFSKRSHLLAREIILSQKNQAIDRLLALPSKMTQMAQGKYIFDDDLLTHIIHVALTNSIRKDEQCQPA